MADRQADGARAPDPARHRSRRRSTAESFLSDLGAARPPCSVAERDIAEALRRRLRSCGLQAAIEPLRAPTSPTWAPLLRALMRVWAAAFLAAGWPVAPQALAGAAIVFGLRPVADLLRFVPVLGSRTGNVVAVRRGRDRQRRPLVVAAHLDTHPTAGAPMRPLHAFSAAASAWAALVGATLDAGGWTAWRAVAGAVAFESVVTLVWLARHELRTPQRPPDDNTSGVLALIRVAELGAGDRPLRDVWIVGTGAGTSGNRGISRFLRSRPQVREGWVIEIDALGTGELVAAPVSPRFPRPGTPPALTRAVAAAARAAGDPLTVRRVFRSHSDARAALRERTGAIVLTGGLRPPTAPEGPDPANAERAARLVNSLARLDV